MPSLFKVTLTSASDGNGFLISGNGSCAHRINTPDNPESIAAAAITSIDVHETLTLPSSGLVAIATAYRNADIAGSNNGISCCIGRSFITSGNMTVPILNYHTTNTNAPVPGLLLFRLFLVKTATDLKHSASGF